MNARAPGAEMLKLDAPAATGWRQTLVALALLLPTIVWLYRDTALAMVTIWSRSDTFAHAYTVPPIAAWLIWRQRHALAAVTPRPAAWLLLPVVLAGVLWLLGELSATNSAMQLAFTATLVFASAALIGTRAARLILFPLCFIFFAVPIGEFVMPQMMVWTADFTVFALRLSGIPVFREGLQFVIPSGNWSVVEACSGVRYLIASFMVGVLFAYLNYRSTTRRLVFAAVSIAVPVVANWVRAYMIVMLGHLSGNQIAVGADHLIYGWVFFGIVIVLMFMIGARWAEPDAQLAVTPPERGDAKARPMAVWLTGAALLAVAALPLAAARQLELGAAPGSALSLLPPPALNAGWQIAPQAKIDWKPDFSDADTELAAVYHSAQGKQVGVYIGYYRQQTGSHKLVSSNNVLVRSKDPVWAKLDEGSVHVGGAGQPDAWRAATLRRLAPIDVESANRLRAWQMYWVNGRLTASDEQAKVYGALYRLLGRGDDAAVIVLHASEATAGEADTLLSGFARDNLGALDALLQRTRSSAAQQHKEGAKP